MEDLPPVSLVIVNYNAGRLLAECVASALPQVAEVVVVDNASADDSIAGLSQKFSGEPRLRIIKNDRNLGFATACNQGMAAAGQPHFMFLNPDCLLPDGSVATMLAAMIRRDDVGMVGGLIINPDGSEQPGGRRAVPTPWRSFVRAFGLHRLSGRWDRLFSDYCLHDKPLPASPIEVEAISGACMLVRREALADVGGWDEGYFLHCEDLDWCMRFRLKGWMVLFVPDAKVIHVGGVCGEGCNLKVEYHKHKGMMRFYKKFFRHQYPFILMSLVALGVWLRFGMVASSSLVRSRESKGAVGE